MGLLQNIYNAGALLPDAPRRLVKGLGYRVLFERTERQRIVLNTIPKSGTTLVSVVFANYMNLSTGGPERPVSLKDVHGAFIPNSREMLLQGDEMKPAHPFFQSTAYKDFLYSHSFRFLEFCTAPVIFLYRNPLDFVVSLYFYNLRFDSNLCGPKGFASPAAALEPALAYFADHFGYMAPLFARRRVLPVAYETLTTSPQQVFSLIFDWLGLPVDAKRLELAVDFSSMDNLRKQEQAEGTFNKEHRPSSMFRSGQIGQWQEHLTPGDVERAKSFLAGRGISLARFRLV